MDGSDLIVAIPLIAAVVGAFGAFLFNLGLKRRDEAQERRALARLVDDDLARIESALEALVSKSSGASMSELRPTRS